MHRLLPTFAILAAGCACEHGIGLSGDHDAEDQNDPDLDQGFDPDGMNPDADEFEPPYIDDPSYEIPVDGLTDPGWRDSVSPWCNPTGLSAGPMDVWSDPGGVYVSISVPSGPHSQEFVYRNNGSGWVQFSEAGGDGWGMTVGRIAGVPYAGRLFGFGRPNSDTRLSNITDAGISWEDFVATDVVVVSEALAYALADGDPPILRWNGTSWGPLPGAPLPYDSNAIWADETSLICAGDGGLVLSREGEDWTILDTGMTVDFYEMWGFGALDIWTAAKASDGAPAVYHYDGITWEYVEPPRVPDEWRNICNRDGVSEFFGVDGTLFYTGATGFGVWNGSAFEAIGSWPHEFIEGGYCRGGLGAAGIWGNAADEVFLAMSGETVTGPGCGYEFILWWDGTNFHWF